MPSSRSLAIVEAIVRGDATFESIPVELWRRQYREHALAEAQRTEDDDDGDEDGHLATHELTRLPPEPGPSGSEESPIRTSISPGSRSNSRAIVSASTLRVPVPMSCVAVLATMRPPLTATSTFTLGCHR